MDDNDDILIISDDGTIIRMAAADISTYSRATQGIKLMRIGDDARVISIARTEKEDEETEFDEEDESVQAPVASSDAEAIVNGEEDAASEVTDEEN